MNNSTFLAKANNENPTNKLIATKLFGNTLLMVDETTLVLLIKTIS